MQVTHEGLRVACKLCDYTSTDSSNLKKHIERVHEGVRTIHVNTVKRFIQKRGDSETILMLNI